MQWLSGKCVFAVFRTRPRYERFLQSFTTRVNPTTSGAGRDPALDRGHGHHRARGGHRHRHHLKPRALDRRGYFGDVPSVGLGILPRRAPVAKEVHGLQRAVVSQLEIRDFNLS
jgi:hypothetical protein